MEKCASTQFATAAEVSGTIVESTLGWFGGGKDYSDEVPHQPGSARETLVTFDTPSVGSVATHALVSTPDVLADK